MSASTGTGREPGRARVDRWRTKSEVLGEVRRTPGLTRVELARRLGLSSASVTETVTRLREAGWITECRAPVQGRGRPTTCLDACPDGPRVVAVDVRHEDWRVGLAGLDGEVTGVVGARHGREPSAVADSPARPPSPRSPRGHRVVAVGLAAPAPVSDDGLVRRRPSWPGTPSTSRSVTAALGPDPVPLRVGNDATLAGVAEARTGAAAGAGTALYLTVEVGLGGALLLDGRPHLGARGAAGEYGHLPFGDPARRCPCGATGCWGPEVDGRALARRLGDAGAGRPPLLRRGASSRGPRAARRTPAAAVGAVAACLARGVAGLVHVHDPDVVVLGGLARGLRASPAFDEAYTRRAHGLPARRPGARARRGARRRRRPARGRGAGARPRHEPRGPGGELRGPVT